MKRKHRDVSEHASSGDGRMAFLLSQWPTCEAIVHALHAAATTTLHDRQTDEDICAGMRDRTRAQTALWLLRVMYGDDPRCACLPVIVRLLKWPSWAWKIARGPGHVPWRSAIALRDEQQLALMLRACAWGHRDANPLPWRACTDALDGTDCADMMQWANDGGLRSGTFCLFFRRCMQMPEGYNALSSAVGKVKVTHGPDGCKMQPLRGEAWLLSEWYRHTRVTQQRLRWDLCQFTAAAGTECRCGKTSPEQLRQVFVDTCNSQHRILVNN